MSTTQEENPLKFGYTDYDGDRIEVREGASGALFTIKTRETDPPGSAMEGTVVVKYGATLKDLIKVLQKLQAEEDGN